MKEHNMFDSEEGQQHRLLILGKLNELMKKWVVQVSKEKVRPYLQVQICMHWR
jgi:poly(A) polymerase Pap1